MKKVKLIFLLLVSCHLVHAQDRLFAIGYVKNYISKDSINFAFTIDLNRIPGSTEKGNGYYFVNDVIAGSRWGWYLKPSADVNIGTGTTTAPNNISLGMPIGLVYDFEKPKVLSFYLEGSPEFVSDKTLDNYLYYFSLGPYLKYEYNSKVLIDLTVGANIALGKRAYAAKTKSSNGYGRYTVPLYLKFVAWNAKGKVNGVPKDFKRVNWTNTLKFNNVYKDNPTTTPDPTMQYWNSKLDFYIWPRVALGLTYNNGFEEPLFKKVHSLSIGVTFARF